MLSGFEKNTWTSFDYLRDKLSDHMNIMLNIESMCKNLSVTNNNVRLDSPLTESITVDTIQTIYDKCEVIDKKITDIGIDLRFKPVSQREDDDSPDITQQLRQQFLAIVPARDNVVSNQLASTNEDTSGTASMIPINLNATPVQSTNSNILIPSDTAPVQSVKHEFYVTKFAVDTTTDAIREYMHGNGVPNLDSVKISCLIPRGKDRSTLSFVSFKVDTRLATVAEIITKPGFWPNNCTIRNFVDKSIVTLTRGNGNSHDPSNFCYHPGTNQTPS